MKVTILINDFRSADGLIVRHLNLRRGQG